MRTILVVAMAAVLLASPVSAQSFDNAEDPLFIRASADVAIVGGEAWAKGTDNGKPFAQHFRYADTFAKRGGQSVAIYTQVTGLPNR